MIDRWLVVTDMDGTLLNHHDYRYEAVLPMLQQLEEMDIPVIFNTSKTFVELGSLVQQFNNVHPFIIENGSAIVVPENYFNETFQQKYMVDGVAVPGYKILVTGSVIAEINSFIQKIRPEAVNFAACSLQQAMELTGLTASEARDAQNRQYSVPLVFSDANKELQFIQQAQQAGFGILKGGRFIHVLGLCDKGSSMQILKELYEQNYHKKYGVIALGDSPNDLDMLQLSDKPVVVKSPSSDSLNLDRSNTIYTQHGAPEGWVEGVQSVLKTLC